MVMETILEMVTVTNNVKKPHPPGCGSFCIESLILHPTNEAKRITSRQILALLHNKEREACFTLFICYFNLAHY